MNRRTILVAALLAGLMTGAHAGVDPGDMAPEFELFGVDYRYHSLAQYADNEAIVVVFTCNHCPYAVDYEDKLVALGNRYQPRGIQFLAVNPNPADMVPADGFPQMQVRAEEKGFPFPYLYDETQQVARAYGATVTPHIFVVRYTMEDGANVPRVVYEGAIDNRHEDPDYLADALEAILAGREIEHVKTAQFGCTVKYRPDNH